MKFVEVVEGFSINIDSIVSVRDDKGVLKGYTQFVSGMGNKQKEIILDNTS